MNQQQFYDKMISRMDKMCASLDKIVRTIEAMQKDNKMMTLEEALKEAYLEHKSE